MRIKKADKFCLRQAGYPEAMREVITNLMGLLADRKQQLELARAGSPEFFKRIGTFASPAKKVTQAEIDKAVKDLTPHVIQMEATLTSLQAELAEFEE